MKGKVLSVRLAKSRIYWNINIDVLHFKLCQHAQISIRIYWMKDRHLQSFEILIF